MMADCSLDRISQALWGSLVNVHFKSLPYIDSKLVNDFVNTSVKQLVDKPIAMRYVYAQGGRNMNEICIRCGGSGTFISPGVQGDVEYRQMTCRCFGMILDSGRATGSPETAKKAMDAAIVAANKFTKNNIVKKGLKSV